VRKFRCTKCAKYQKP